LLKSKHAAAWAIDSAMKRQPVIEVIDRDMAAILRSKTGAERLRIANGMYLSARRMILSDLRAKHPQWDELRLNEAAARRLAHRTR
jgi:hypothetical protein